MRCRAPGPALARPARPPAADDVPVPPQDGARGDDQPHRGETIDRQRPGQQGKQRPVRPRQPGTNPRPLAPGDSELVAQHEDLGVLPPRLPARQAQQRHGTGNDQEDQLQAHKPKIIPPPVGPRPARRMPNAPPRSAGLCPGGAGCRHPQACRAGFCPASACRRRPAAIPASRKRIEPPASVCAVGGLRPSTYCLLSRQCFIWQACAAAGTLLDQVARRLASRCVPARALAPPRQHRFRPEGRRERAAG